MANRFFVCYSRNGKNYWNGVLNTITKGNIERVAEFVQKKHVFSFILLPERI